MKENIEVKDVQKTEYLDKNGLDMLWAKVKENTHNQVEIERNRAVAKENSIVDTKADKSEFSNYVPSATFTALEKKVSANTAAISNKQNAGNYLHYETLNDEGYYEIPNVCISESDAKLKAILSPYAFQITAGDLEGDGVTGVVITSSDRDPYIALTDSAYVNTLKITREGISNADNNANHVYATDGSIADLTQYAKKSEITTGGNVDDVQVNGVSVVENKIANIKPATKESLGVVKVGDGLNVADGTISVDTTAIGAGNYIPYNKATNVFYYLYNVGIISQKEDGSNKTIQCPVFFEQSDENHSVTIRGGYINISNTQGNLMTLNKNDKDGGIVIYKHGNNSVKESLRILEDGIRLMGGDNNHVLTSNASTIDITQYVLKSVYDEKIAVLEARIAALEAKHAETD